MSKGLIIINKYSTMPSMLHQASRIKEEFDKLGVEIEIVKNGYFPYLNDNCDIENTYKNIDFVVYLDKDKYQGELIEKSGIRCFNKISSITNCDDKMLTFIKLSGKGIKIPKTISAPLCYGDYDIDENSLKEVGDTLKYPLVLKLSFSSLGKGVFLINTFEELVETMILP